MIRTLFTTIIILVLFYRIALKKPVFVFYLAISLFFDPGGYLSEYLNNVINYKDITFTLCFLPLFSSKINSKAIYSDPYFRKIFTYLVFYQIYYLLFYAYITPMTYGRDTFLSFLYSYRLQVFSIFIIFPAYAIALKDVQTFIKITAYSALIILLLFFLSIFSGLNLIPITYLERYVGSGIIRITLNSWGLFSNILFFAIIVYISKFKVPNKKIIYLAGYLMFTAMMITLTRRLYLLIGGTSIYIMFLISKLQNKSISSLINKWIFYIIIALAILGLFFPFYVKYLSSNIQDLYSLITTGTNIQGEEDYRFAGTGGIAYLKEDIKKRPFFGTGYYKKWYDSTDDFSHGRYKAHDNPGLGVFAMFGFVGVFLYYIFYIILIKILFKIYKLTINKRKFLVMNNYDIIMIIYIFSFFLYKFTFGIPGLASELIYSHQRITLMFYIGMLLALNRKMQILDYSNKILKKGTE